MDPGPPPDPPLVKLIRKKKFREKRFPFFSQYSYVGEMDDKNDIFQKCLTFRQIIIVLGNLDVNKRSFSSVAVLG